MRKIQILLIVSFFSNHTFTQPTAPKLQINGNLETRIAFYRSDSTLNFEAPSNLFHSNSYLNLGAEWGKFSAGTRLESYVYEPLLGYDKDLKGTGLAHKYIKYKTDKSSITLGNFYEQFGTGMILRAEENKNLGIDNSFYGMNISKQIFEAIYIKALIGKQRLYFNYGEGLVSGGDIEINISQLLKSKKSNFIFGSSFVTKYQKDIDPIYILSENVAAWALRTQYSLKDFSIYSEFASKINDPSTDNNYIYKNGNALMVNLSYTQKGLGILLTAKRVDNMNYRSDRNATSNNLYINYIPTLDKTHTYSLLNMYPYISENNGEIGFRTELSYMFKKKSTLGGKYGTQLSAYYVQSNDIYTIPDSTGEGYVSEFFKVGKTLFYRRFNIEIYKKINKKLKGTLLVDFSTYYNKNNILQLMDNDSVYSKTIISDIAYKITSRTALRFEFQHLWSEQATRNWLMYLMELTVSPKWFFTFSDEYNYNHPVSTKQFHYPKITLGYRKGLSRLEFSYGRQREGIVCIGGICRFVPATTGLNITFSTKF